MLLECAEDRVALSHAASTPVRVFGRCSSERRAGVVVEASTTHAILGVRLDPVKPVRRQATEIGARRLLSYGARLLPQLLAANSSVTPPRDTVLPRRVGE